MKRILITAIGSMSTECVIKQLRKQDVFIVGCDIYPAEWHYESMLCDVVYKAPLAKNEDEYVSFLLNVCKKHSISYIFPSTDLEIDVLRKYRDKFADINVVLCMQDEDVLNISRNKYNLYKKFEYDNVVNMPKTLLYSPDLSIEYPCIAKPWDGRSSEGVKIIRNKQDFSSITGNKYILQELKEGNIITVDYIRDAKNFIDVVIARRELLRTKNGAGLTVKCFKSSTIDKIVSHIGNVLNVNGCINMEFIESDGNYFLIDINPRFSAGIAYSVLSGYDMVNNHLCCFEGRKIEEIKSIEEMIIVKKYEEVVINVKNIVSL